MQKLVIKYETFKNDGLNLICICHLNIKYIYIWQLFIFKSYFIRRHFLNLLQISVKFPSFKIRLNIGSHIMH